VGAQLVADRLAGRLVLGEDVRVTEVVLFRDYHENSWQSLAKTEDDEIEDPCCVTYYL